MSRERTLRPLWTAVSSAGQKLSCLQLRVVLEPRLGPAVSSSGVLGVANVNGIFWPMWVNRTNTNLHPSAQLYPFGIEAQLEAPRSCGQHLTLPQVARCGSDPAVLFGHSFWLINLNVCTHTHTCIEIYILYIFLVFTAQWPWQQKKIILMGHQK